MADNKTEVEKLETLIERAKKREIREEGDRHLFKKALGDIQGNVLAGYKGLSAASFHYLTFRPNMARPWLKAVQQKGCLTKQRACDDQDKEIAPTFNVAFTCEGLRQLGVHTDYIDQLSDPFRSGMQARSEKLNEGDKSLGDTDASAPDKWQDTFKGSSLHALVTVHTRQHSNCDEPAETPFPDLLTSEKYLAYYRVQQAAWLKDHTEHFGFKDGIGRPRIRGAQRDLDNPKRSVQENCRYADRPIALGEFLLGYETDGTNRQIRGAPVGTPAYDLTKNGTYMVYRKLEQDVAGFRKFVYERSGGDEKKANLLAAQIIGRWRDGTPLLLNPLGTSHVNERDLDAFDYDTPRRNDFAIDENDGLCPLGAHVRRMNPRKKHLATHKRRILRRGVPYGPPLPNWGADNEERGLIFIALNSSIEEQFEFLQSRWANSGNFRGLNSYERDPLIGANDGGERSQFRIRGEHICRNLPRFVTVKGGAYLFVPSLTALAGLSKGSFSKGFSTGETQHAATQQGEAIERAISKSR